MRPRPGECSAWRSECGPQSAATGLRPFLCLSPALHGGLLRPLQQRCTARPSSFASAGGRAARRRCRARRAAGLTEPSAGVGSCPAGLSPLAVCGAGRPCVRWFVPSARSAPLAPSPTPAGRPGSAFFFRRRWRGRRAFADAVREARARRPLLFLRARCRGSVRRVASGLPGHAQSGDASAPRPTHRTRRAVDAPRVHTPCRTLPPSAPRPQPRICQARRKKRSKNRRLWKINFGRNVNGGGGGESDRRAECGRTDAFQCGCGHSGRLRAGGPFFRGRAVFHVRGRARRVVGLAQGVRFQRVRCHVVRGLAVACRAVGGVRSQRECSAFEFRTASPGPAECTRTRCTG